MRKKIIYELQKELIGELIDNFKILDIDKIKINNKDRIELNKINDEIILYVLRYNKRIKYNNEKEYITFYVSEKEKIITFYLTNKIDKNFIITYENNDDNFYIDFMNEDKDVYIILLGKEEISIELNECIIYKKIKEDLNDYKDQKEIDKIKNTNNIIIKYIIENINNLNLLYEMLKKIIFN